MSLPETINKQQNPATSAHQTKKLTFHFFLPHSVITFLQPHFYNPVNYNHNFEKHVQSVKGNWHLRSQYLCGANKLIF